MTSMPCSPLSSRRDVRVVEEPLGAGEPERRAGDRPPARSPGASPATAAGDGLGEHARPAAPRRGARRGARLAHGAADAAAPVAPAAARTDSRATGSRSGAEARGPQAAQGVVERRHVALLGVVAGEADDRVVAEHVGGEALQRVLRADLDEDPRALVVQRVQALDELHRRGDLAAEHVEHLLDGAVAGRIELAVDVGHDRQPGGRRPRRWSIARSGSLAGATISVWKAWLTGQRDRGVPALLHRGHGASDRVGGAAEHDLVRRVDVGEHDVAVGPGDDLLDLRQRGHDRRHRAGVVDSEARHLASAGADRLERVLERQRRRRRPGRRTRRRSGP